MSDRADEGFRAAAERFLRGGLTVPDLTYAVRDATNGVVQQRTLRGWN